MFGAERVLRGLLIETNVLHEKKLRKIAEFAIYFIPNSLLFLASY